MGDSTDILLGEMTGKLDDYWESANRYLGSENQLKRRYKLALLCAGSSAETLYFQRISPCKISFRLNYSKRAAEQRRYQNEDDLKPVLSQVQTSATFTRLM